MLMDNLLQLCSSLVLLPASEIAGGPGCGVLTAAGGIDSNLGKFIDNRNPRTLYARQIGAGEEAYISLTTKVVVANPVSVRICFVSSSVPNPANLAACTIHADTGVILTGALATYFAAGKVIFNQALPNIGLDKYIGFWQVSGAGATTGAFDGQIVAEGTTSRALPGAVGGVGIVA